MLPFVTVMSQPELYMPTAPGPLPVNSPPFIVTVAPPEHLSARMLPVLPTPVNLPPVMVIAALPELKYALTSILPDA